MIVTPAIHPSLRGLAYFAENKIPFHRELGLQIVYLQPGHVIARIPSKPELTGDPLRPAVHGGIISLLADVVGGFAVFSSTHGKQERVNTIDLRTDSLRPGRTDSDLYGVGRTIRAGSRIAVARMQIYSTDTAPMEEASLSDDLIAIGQASYNVNRTPVLRADKETD